MLDARADVRGGGLEQRHGLALHVRSHERAVRVVMLEERDERRRDRRHLTRGDVHVVDLADRHLGRLAEDALGVAGAAEHAIGRDERAVHGAAEDAGLLIEEVVRLGDRVLLLLVRGQVVDLVGDLAVDDAAIRRLDEAVRVDARIGRQRADQADVRAFRRFDRAHAAVVGVVDVADFEACALAGQAARAEGRQAALVRDAGGGIGLVHELRQLRGTEEFLDGGDDRADVHQGLRGDLVGFLHAHALAHDALHAGQADAELVLDQLADRADAAVAEVVDVVDLEAFLAAVQRDDVTHRGDDVALGERGGSAQLVVGIEAELLVGLVAADLREIIALRIEEQAVEQRGSGVQRGRLARAEALVELDQGFFLSSGGIAIEGAQHHLGAAKDLDDLLARFGDAQRAEEQRGRLLALAIDANGEDVALIGLEFEPCTAGRDDLRAVDGLVGRLIALGGEVDAGRTDELRDDDALGAVDDEGPARGHEREVAHEDLLLFDFARLAIDEADLGEQRSLVGNVLFLAFVDRVLRVAELMGAEFDEHVLRGALDRADGVERLRDAFGHEPREAVRLDGDQIGHVHDVGDLRETATIPVNAGWRALFCFGHRFSFRW